MKTSGYLVTYDNLTTMGLTTKSTPPTGSRIATKSFINTYYYVNNGGAFANYASNQCVPYQYIIGSVPNSGTMYYSSSGGGNNYFGFASPSAACSHSSGGSVTGNNPSIVGENGPEIFVPDRAGTVIPNNKISDIMGNSGGSIVYNGPYIASMSAIDTQSATQFLAKNKMSNSPSSLPFV